MTIRREDVLDTKAAIEKEFTEKISVGLLTGTGLSDSLDNMSPVCCFDYSDLPHFPVSTIEGHKGKLMIGRVEKVNLVVMQGRFHLYEGYSPAQVSYPVRVMQELGIDTLIVTNAAGGINLDYNAGDIMVITDHINLTGHNPLVGANQGQWGIRFPDMTQVYDKALIRMALDAARENNISAHEGVYAGLLGPSLETPAEIRFLKTIGSDAVGLSTIMEVIAGVHAKMKILGLSLITNINNPDQPCETTLESVLHTARQSVPRLNSLLSSVLRKLG